MYKIDRRGGLGGLEVTLKEHLPFPSSQLLGGGAGGGVKKRVL